MCVCVCVFVFFFLCFLRRLRDCKENEMREGPRTPHRLRRRRLATFGGSQSVVSKRMVLADVPLHRKKEGTKSGTTVPKTGARVQKTERRHQKSGIRAHSAKPPFTPLFPLDRLTLALRGVSALWVFEVPSVLVGIP